VTEFSVIFTVFMFVGFILVSGPYFYRMELKSLSKKMTTSLGVDILQLNCSLEQMVYFVSLPSNLPILQNAKKEDLLLECEYTSIFFPQLAGVKISIQNDAEKLMLAYLPIKNFRLPRLDRFLEEGKINENNYLKMSAYKLIHPTTIKEIKEDVYKQLEIGRNASL
jgi:hypothetical protein